MIWVLWIVVKNNLCRIKVCYTVYCVIVVKYILKYMEVLKKKRTFAKIINIEI